MSFILDALKKSETDRQEQASTEFASIPSAVDEAGPPRWIWVLGGLLLINVAVLGALFMRGGNDEGARTVDTRPNLAADEPSFSERLDVAGAERPARREDAPVAATPAAAPVVRAAAPAVQEPAPRVREPLREDSALALPTLTEIRLDNGVDLPDLNLDIHVYGASATERFVFIDMQKYQEGDMLDAGPRLEAITPDGVVLEFRGTRFVLPRE